MPSELFLYDRDKGLFKLLLNKSKVIEGRYHIAPNYGHELNTNNLDQYFKDEASGITIPQKYPCCVCIAPRSRFIDVNGSTWEEFYFHLFFLCTTYYTGKNEVKAMDRDTKTSTHHIWYDWAGMKDVAAQFMQALKDKLKFERQYVNIEPETNINRLSKYNNDRLSGVGISFRAQLYVGACELTDYDAADLVGITLPDFDIHPSHKH